MQIMDAAFADAARRAGSWLACKPGCTQCCHGAFAMNALDALRLQSGMEDLRRQNPEIAAKVSRRTQAWITEHGPNFPGDLASGLLGESEEEKEAFEDFANEAACPALDPATGCCDLYVARPMTCRIFGPPVRTETEEGEALGCCELCFQGASEETIAACEMYPPHDLESRLLEELGESGETVVALVLRDTPA